MKFLPFLLIAFLFSALPGLTFANVDKCDGQAADCTCTVSIGSPPAQISVSTIEACQSHCSQTFSGETYHVQCLIGGQLTTIANTNVNTSQDLTTSGTATVPPKEFPLLKLNIPIPGLTLTKPTTENGFVVSNYIGEYVEAVYKLLISVAGLIAVVLVMVGGFQWIAARGDAGAVGKAKKRISDAVTGLVLIFSAVAIAEIIDPTLTTFESLKIDTVESIFYEDMSGPEGTAGGDPLKCRQAVTEAKEKGRCKMKDSAGNSVKMSSPVDPTSAKTYACGYHFKDYNYETIRAADYPAAFGSPIYAPFDGAVTYKEGTKDAPGNRIDLQGSGAVINMGHVKDFYNGTASGTGTLMTDGTQVKKGQIIGHVGGACCTGQVPDAGKFTKGYCRTEGTMCTGPKDASTCQCQRWEHAGNSTGPHVHVNFSSSGGHFLTCHE